jgi:hypothetical protein
MTCTTPAACRQHACDRCGFAGPRCQRAVNFSNQDWAWLCAKCFFA